MYTTLKEQINAIQLVRNRYKHGAPPALVNALNDAASTLVAVNMLINDKTLAGEFTRFVVASPPEDTYGETLIKFLKQRGLPVS